MTQQPLALVYGEQLEKTPTALYIPPAALRVRLDNFSGPLDLLLYLVRKHKFDIMDIPMAELCRNTPPTPMKFSATTWKRPPII